MVHKNSPMSTGSLITTGIRLLPAPTDPRCSLIPSTAEVRTNRQLWRVDDIPSYDNYYNEFNSFQYYDASALTGHPFRKCSPTYFYLLYYAHAQLRKSGH